METKRNRLKALDAARGFAILLMLLAHFVSAELEAPIRNGLGSLGDLVTQFLGAMLTILNGKGAALFCCLAGVSWSIMAQRHSDETHFASQFFRRAAGLFVLGVVFAKTAWNTEVLSFFGLYMCLCYPLLHAPRWLLVMVMGALLCLTPVGNLFFGEFVQSDWRADGSFIDPHGFGWPMLRHYVFNGSYPTVPFLVLPLIGLLLGRVSWTRGLAKRCALYGLGLGVLIQCFGFWVAGRASELGALAPHLGCHWLPTTVPFITLGASTAVGLVGLFFWLYPPSHELSSPEEEYPLPRARAWSEHLIPLGRLSLTHYVAHVYLVFLPMAWTGFPVVTGLVLALGYAWLGTKFSLWCLNRWSQGPLERLLRWIAGPSRPSATP